jgi:hypothetical protein
MKGKGAWRVASYEIDMHETLFEGPSQMAISNALTESVVLHARQLCEIFLSRSTEADNVKLADLVPAGHESAAQETYSRTRNGIWQKQERGIAVLGVQQDAATSDYRT